LEAVERLLEALERSGIRVEEAYLFGSCARRLDRGERR
jgi:predicted nucleotidyltransferase